MYPLVFDDKRSAKKRRGLGRVGEDEKNSMGVLDEAGLTAFYLLQTSFPRQRSRLAVGNLMKESLSTYASNPHALTSLHTKTEIKSN